MSKYKTSEEKYRYFKKEVAYFQAKLGLLEWHVYVFHDELDGAFANTATSQSGACATITLNKTWVDREPSYEELRECALHEVLHILTAPLLLEANARFASEFALEVEEHTIVTRLTNLLKEII